MSKDNNNLLDFDVVDGGGVVVVVHFYFVRVFGFVRVVDCGVVVAFVVVDVDSEENGSETKLLCCVVLCCVSY